jgi:enoyl-CoA hydratase
MTYQVFKVERKEGGIAVITFNRPDKFNAANRQIFSELAAAVQELDADPEVGCMILTGQIFTHPKKGTPFPVFSAGADVEQFAHVSKTEAGFDFVKACFEPFKAILRLQERQVRIEGDKSRRTARLGGNARA